MSGINAPFESFTALTHDIQEKIKKTVTVNILSLILFFSEIDEGQPNHNHE